MPAKKTAKTITDEIARTVKRRGPTPGTRPDKAEWFTPQVEPGEVSTLINETLEIMSWPPVDTDDADQVAQRIRQYQAFCAQVGMRPSVVGIALSLGTTRKTLWNWENGVESDKPQAVRDAIKRGRAFNELLMEQYMQTGKINPVSGIFLLKNHHGYKDQQDVVITPNSPLASGDADETRKKYLEALPDETDDQQNN